MALLLAGTLLAFLRAEVPTNAPNRTLTFAEHVAYQRAIEDVYWRHRIWPKENTNPKPSLDAVMSQAQLEKKVEDYLRNSQALEDYWQRPITAEQLQAEMDRFARDTKQPEVLRELFDVLGNDPTVIAECLARPILAARLIADLSMQDKARRFDSPRTDRLHRVSMVTSGQVPYTLPKIANETGTCVDDTWTPTSTNNAPDARYEHTAVWTGSEMIVWGGLGIGNIVVNSGGKYDPNTDSWTATSTTNAPEARWRHKAIWTGSEMIVWGGFDNMNFFNTGGRYNPSTDTWIPTSTTNAPSARGFHTAVWTSSEMIVWGGLGIGNIFVNSGGKYDPNTDSWTATSTTNAPEARWQHTAVWTSSEMIVWGGNNFNTGGRYNPNTDSWTATNPIAPIPRLGHTAVWTGSEMIVWGADLFGNTGGRYNPNTDSWRATNTLAPEPRTHHTAIWTGSEMVVWGGDRPPIVLDSGGKYDPRTDSWTSTSTTNAPEGRSFHTAVWTGSKMIVWGGNDNVNPLSTPGPLNTGGTYCVHPSPTPTPRTLPTPRSRRTPIPRP